MVIEDDLVTATTAVQSGRLDVARSLLAKILQENPDNEAAWMWLAACVDDREKRAFCLRRVLMINPANQPAREQLDALLSPEVLPDPPAQANPIPSPPLASRPPAVKAPLQAAARPTRKNPSLFSWMAAHQMLTLGILLLVLALTGVAAVSTVLSQARALTGGNPPDAMLLASTSTPPRLPPTWTVTSSPLPDPSRTVIPSPSPLPIPSMDLSKVWDRNRVQTTLELMRQERYAEAVTLWSEGIEKSPANVDFYYYQRGLSYLKLVDHEHSYAEFQNHLNRAVQDFDRAIALNPGVGEYYYQRALTYSTMVNVFPYRVDTLRLWTIALENQRAAHALGNSIAYSEREIPFLLTRLGKCQQSLEELQKLVNQRVNQPESGGLNDQIASAYLCLEQYDLALEHINRAIQVESTCERLQSKTIILMGMERWEDALEVTSASIKKCPSYGGYRYYLRALIQYDRGKKDLAEQDLLTGSRYTWYSEGLCSYLRARFALDAGNTEEGARLLRYAEATHSSFEGPALLKRIRAEMAALNIAPEKPLTQFVAANTPLPADIFLKIPPTVTPGATITPTHTARPSNTPPTPMTPFPTDTADPNPLPVEFQDAIEIDATRGTGPLTLKPFDYPLFHLVPADALKVKQATRIIFYVLPEGIEGRAPLAVFLWGRNGVWGPIDPQWGENFIELDANYIGPGGDLYFHLRNFTDQTVTLDNAGFNITVKLEDGSSYRYGLMP